MKKNQHHGISRQNRLLRSFSPEKACIDDRNIDRFLAFASDFSTLVNFYTTDNRIEGDWSAFFKNNPVAVLGIIAHTPLNLNQQRYSDAIGVLKKEIEALRTLHEKSGEEDHTQVSPEVGKKVFRMAYELAAKINTWYLIFSTSDKAYASFREEIRNAITQSLREEINTLRQFEEWFPDSFAYLFKNFDAEVWNYTPLTQKKQEAGTTAMLEKLAESLWSFNRTALYLNSRAQEEIKKHLNDDSPHPPHMALFITFLKLFGYSQKLLNGISGRHLDFYYRQILREQETPALGDNIHALVELSSGTTEFLLPEGTRLTAGKDTLGNPIEYVTTEDILLNQASIANLKTLCLASNPLIYPVGEKKLITGIYVAQQANSPDGLSDPVPPEAMPEGWPVFGEDQSMYSAEERTMGDGRIGFALASEILRLSEGERRIFIQIKFILYFWMKLVEQIKTEFGPFTDFYQRLPHIFTLTATGENGWIPLTINFLKFNGTEGSMDLEIQLPESAAPLVNFNPEIHSGRYTRNEPILQFCLNSDTPFYSYSFLKDLAIKHIDIRVEVSGIRKLLLYNQNGPVNADKPFEPFGPIPQKGSYLAIGYPEAVRKDLTSLSVNLNWFGLPPEGFASYYTHYGQPFGNAIFRVNASIFRAGKWMPNAAAQQSFALFVPAEKTDPEGALLPFTPLDPIDLDMLQFRPYSDTEMPMEPASGSLQGFLKLTLTEPPYGFGQDLYAEALSQIMLENARNKKEEKKLPQKPYIPVLESLSMNYSAEARVDFSIHNTLISPQIQFFHLTPFSEYEAFPDRTEKDLPPIDEKTDPYPSSLEDAFEKAKKEYLREMGSLKFLFPLYASKRYLFIGLEQLPVPGSLNLLFQLIPNAGIKTQPELPALRWTYLSKQEWKEFEAGSEPVDDTLGLIRPGIIRFTVPSDISSEHTVMPSGIYWIRVEATSDTAVLSRVLAIGTQALKASKILTPGNNSITLLAPESIKSLSQPIPQIKAITQPFVSFGGKPAEDRTAFYTRMSERLRHKKRAVSCWDYERLVLQTFPSVYKVCCLPISDLKNESEEKTNVMLVVIPTPETAAQANIKEPKVSYRTLEEIKKYIAGYTSPFVNVEVRNPTYDRLKIVCSVKFRPGKSPIFFVQQLNTEICVFLSPWLETPGKGQQIGGSISRSAILNFIEKRPYVDYVTGFSVLQLICNDHHYDLKDSAIPRQDADLIEGSTPWTVLSTASQHLIRAITEEKHEAPQVTGIDLLQIGEDFVLTEPESPKTLLSAKLSPLSAGRTEEEYFIINPL